MRSITQAAFRQQPVNPVLLDLIQSSPIDTRCAVIYAHRIGDARAGDTVRLWDLTDRTAPRPAPRF